MRGRVSLGAYLECLLTGFFLGPTSVASDMSRAKRKLFATNVDHGVGGDFSVSLVKKEIHLSDRHRLVKQAESGVPVLAFDTFPSDLVTTGTNRRFSVRATTTAQKSVLLGCPSATQESGTTVPPEPLSYPRSSRRRQPAVVSVDASSAALSALRPQRRARKKGAQDLGAPTGEVTGADSPVGALVSFVETSQSVSTTVLLEGPADPASAASPAPAGKQPRRRRTKVDHVVVESTEVSAIIVKGPASIKGDEEFQAALEHLKAADAKLAAVIDDHRAPELWNRQSSPFWSLASTILSQQLSTKVADVIRGRLVSLCGVEEAHIVPETVLKFSVPDLRAVGLSNAKARYLLGLADHFFTGKLSDTSILAMDDQALMEALTAVKGIGVWSVNMFMMFSLFRPDVLPVGDLGIRKGFQKLYTLKGLPDAAEMEAIAAKWRPYRSVGCFYLWSMMDTKAPVTGAPVTLDGTDDRPKTS